MMAVVTLAHARTETGTQGGIDAPEQSIRRDPASENL
jgi:hypothetical protein